MRVQRIEYEISIGFAQKGPTREFGFWNVFNKGLYGVRFFFLVLNYQDSTVFMNLQIFSLKCK